MDHIVPGSDQIRILLVEDEFLIAEWIAEALSEQGFAVHAVSNAGDALRYLAAEPVDILFTDINLGTGMDGTALSRRARELRADLPVVYASAYAPLRLGDGVPGAAFLRKPYEAHAVVRLIRAVVKPAKAFEFA